MMGAVFYQPTPTTQPPHNTPQDGSKPASPLQHQQLLVLTKGAPEAVQVLLDSVPTNYAATYLYHMGRGRRVLALAYRCVCVICVCV